MANTDLISLFKTSLEFKNIQLTYYYNKDGAAPQIQKNCTHKGTLYGLKDVNRWPSQLDIKVFPKLVASNWKDGCFHIIVSDFA